MLEPEPSISLFPFSLFLIYLSPISWLVNSPAPALPSPPKPYCLLFLWFMPPLNLPKGILLPTLISNNLNTVVTNIVLHFYVVPEFQGEPDEISEEKCKVAAREVCSLRGSAYWITINVQSTVIQVLNMYNKLLFIIISLDDITCTLKYKLYTVEKGQTATRFTEDYLMLTPPPFRHTLSLLHNLKLGWCFQGE